ncbi:NAD(P)H-dependent oxidoreductase subunit E [uncultured Ilyobacter sp.]|jgi:NADH:ubiquinone oxidoreductase subunit E|uniref:NADH-quinone oxidoreductase subunit NuoE family protein n=1 Tax=uncultured Ilyobacter sp. TaxID=544433 RepID=UPI0029C0145F|nr:NAD(P)H-dependent oxidoreductase subunit E [uncultured Ilyobacter sp.]
MITQEFYQNLGNFIDEMEDKRDEIQVLNFVMKEIGYIPLEVQEFIADKTGLFLVTIQNAIDFFPKYKTSIDNTVEIKVCTGLGCTGKGGLLILEELERKLGIEAGETTKDGKYKLTTQRCFGKCAKGPNLSIGGVLYNNVAIENLEKLLKIDAK